MILLSHDDLMDFIVRRDIRLVAFDIRGTLLRAPRNGHLTRALRHTTISGETLARLDADVPGRVLDQYRASVSVTDWTLVTLLEAVRLAGELGEPVDSVDVENAFQHLNREYREQSIPLVDDEMLYETVLAMQRGGLRVVFAADGPTQREREVLNSCLPKTASLGLDIYSSELAGVNKLSNDYFARIVAYYDERAADVLIIGDRLEKDVRPAQQVGCHAILVGLSDSYDGPQVQTTRHLLLDTPHRVTRAVVLGRFQPFHLEHERYVLAALERADQVIVGITHPFESMPEPGETRNDDGANPLPLWLRVKLIENWAKRSGFAERLIVTPLPLSQDGLHSSVSPDVPFFITEVEPWNRRKREIIESAGFAVRVLDVGEKTISATDIRELIRAGHSDWQHLIPAAIDQGLMNEAIQLIASR